MTIKEQDDMLGSFAAVEAELRVIPQFVNVRPWTDSVAVADGHDAHSRYVELFWLSVLGPTATWLLRRFADGLDMFPDGYELDLHETAQAIGLSAQPGRSTAFARALGRCVMFNMARRSPDGFDVRRIVPSLELRHVRRLPEHLRLAHSQWHFGHDSDTSVIELRRAEAVATALLSTGDDLASVERRLALIGTPPAVAEAALKAVA